jgi:hypothetical protein
VSGSIVSKTIDRRWLRFFERLGIYLLVGPAVAWVIILLLAIVLGGLLYSFQSQGPIADPRFLVLLLGFIYVVALPIVGIYATLIAIVLAVSTRVSFWHVAGCALLVSLVLYLPALILMAPSEDESADGIYWRAFIFVFLPVLAAGLACWLIAPALHRRAG